MAEFVAKYFYDLSDGDTAEEMNLNGKFFITASDENEALYLAGIRIGMMYGSILDYDPKASSRISPFANNFPEVFIEPVTD